MPDYSFYSSFRRSRNSLDNDENTPLSDRHQQGRSFDEEDNRESTFEAPPSPEHQIPARSSSSGGCFSCQMLLLFLIGGFVAFQEVRMLEINSLLLEQTALIQQQQSQIKMLNYTIGGELGFVEKWEHSVDKRIHLLESAMGKFNNTVSNSQVVDRLNEVDVDLADMTIYLNQSLHSMLTTVSSTMRTASTDIHRELDLAQTDILERLGQTNNDLNDAVKEAKEEIQEEVASVRSSMNEYVQITNSQFRAENDFLKYQLAGTFTLLGMMIAVWHVTQHVRHMNRPTVQRRIIAILNMVPVYGITSWLSLVFPIVRAQLGVLRDCYEAYAVYTFFAFLCEVLKANSSEADSDTDLVLIIEENARHKLNTGHGMLRPPLYCPCGLDQYPLRMLSRAALRQCRFCLMQFVLLKPLLTLAPYFFAAIGVAYETHPPLLSNHIPDLTSPMLYGLVISNVSVSLAFYGLVSFYHLVDDELAWVDPWPKFLCIKGVVFMTFWQGFVINLCGQFGYIDAETAVSAQDFLICIEMFIASIAHFYIFQHKQWEAGYKERRDAQLQTGSTFRASDNFAFPDFANDIRRDFGLIGRSDPQDELDNLKAEIELDDLKKNPVQTVLEEGEEQEEEEKEATVDDSQCSGDVEVPVNAVRDEDMLLPEVTSSEVVDQPNLLTDEPLNLTQEEPMQNLEDISSSENTAEDPLENSSEKVEEGRSDRTSDKTAVAAIEKPEGDGEDSGSGSEDSGSGSEDSDSDIEDSDDDGGGGSEKGDGISVSDVSIDRKKSTEDLMKELNASSPSPLPSPKAHSNEQASEHSGEEDDVFEDALHHHDLSSSEKKS